MDESEDDKWRQIVSIDLIVRMFFPHDKLFDEIKEGFVFSIGFLFCRKLRMGGDSDESTFCYIYDGFKVQGIII